MSEDYRSNFVKSLETTLVSLIPTEQLVIVTDTVLKLLADYELSERCTDIVPAESPNERILKRYCACLMVDGKSEKTIYQYKRTLIRLSDSLEKPFTEMGAYDIRYYLACEKERGVSNRSLENLRSNISAFFQWMSREELIQKNPMEVIKPIKYVKEVRTAFSDVEIDSMRSACRTIRERAIMEFLLSSGVRVSELCSMNADDVDLTSMMVRVRHGKGGKERVTYINPVTASYLTRYIRVRKDKGNCLFYNKTHERINPGGIRFILKGISERSGVTNVHPHRFRRTFATGLASRGMEIQEIQRLLGHSNINTTLEYVCLDDERILASYKKYIA